MASAAHSLRGPGRRPHAVLPARGALGNAADITTGPPREKPVEAQYANLRARMERRGFVRSRRPGYRGVKSAQSVATLSQLTPIQLVNCDGHSATRLVSRHLSNILLRRRTIGTLIP